MSIVETVSTKPATARRVTYGILIKAGTFTLNEWGLTESDARTVNEILVSNGDKPFELNGLTFSRRPPSDLSAQLAAFKASMAAPAAK
jgi:hypothetical protein